MHTHTLRLAGLALLPLLASSLWFLLPADIPSTTRIFAIAGVTSAMLLAAAWFIGGPIDRTRSFTDAFRTDAYGEAPEVPPEFPADSVEAKLIENDRLLREARAKHKADRATMFQWAASLHGVTGAKSTPPAVDANPMDAVANILTDVGKQYQTIKGRLHLMQVMMHALPVPLVVIDEQGRLRILNQQAETMLGLNSASMAGKTVDQVLSVETGGTMELLRSSPNGLGVGTIAASGGKADVRFHFSKLAGKEPLIIIAVQERTRELMERDTAAAAARHATAQFVIQEKLLAELPLAEGLQAKARLVLGDVKQKAEKNAIVSRVASIQQDLDQVAIRLKLWEWLYRTEWTAVPEPDPIEISGDLAVQECMKSMAGIFASRKQSVTIANRNAGWLCVDKDLLFNGLLGLLSFASRSALGEKLEIRLEKLPPTAELQEGWMTFSVVADWNPETWPVGVPDTSLDAILTNPAADATLGLVVATRIAGLLQGICRTEEGSDGRRCVRLYVPTRLPTANVVVADTEVGPREELCIGWKLGVAV